MVAGILFGVLALLGWGVSDFLVAAAVRKSDAMRVLLWGQLVAVVIAGSVFLVLFDLPEISLSTVGIVLLCGVLSAVSWGAFYKGLEVGKVSVLSPVANCWPIITVALSLLFLGETLAWAEVGAVALILLGAILASFRFRDLLRLRSPAAGVQYALVGVVGWGVLFYFVGVLVPRIGWFLPMLLIKAVSVVYLATYFSARRTDASFPREVWLLILLIGLLEMAASAAYSFGVTLEQSAVIAPIIAGVPMVTAILARIHFGERLEWNQDLGILAIVVGLVLLAL